ncbi:MAG: glycyl-radical enzyme activating protein [Bacteroidaceae bacterium]|nr:glycyl-radical enzyme activating protein [Bacteroidaceae bacterium]
MPLIFDIKRFALNDGPGIRTTLFLKGCPLRCVWCHNPEGQRPEAQRLYTKKKCIGCGTCVSVCPQGALQLTPDGIRPTSEACLLCGACAEACPTTALTMSGRTWTMDELMAEVEKERQVMEESGGGVTLCGGEPLMHPDYAVQLLDELGRRRFHRAVDTTLYASPDVIRRVAQRCELFLVDLKHMDSALHRRYTGVANERILDGLRLVASLGTPYWVRIPLIEGINADEANITASARFLASLPTPPQVVNLLVYHDIGKNKHARLGTTYNPDALPMSAPSDAVQQRSLDILAAHGLAARVGG